MSVELGPSLPRENHTRGLTSFGNKVPRKKFGIQEDNAAKNWRNFHNEVHNT